MKKHYIILLILFVINPVSAQIINIPDIAFKNKLLSANSSNTVAKDLSGNYFKIDSNNDNQLQVSEAEQVGYLNISNTSIFSLIGIENFQNLSELNCNSNNLVTLDIGSLANLQILGCSFNLLTILNLGESLVSLECIGNHLTSLNLNNLIYLEYLNCSNNDLMLLDLSPVINLQYLVCGGNLLTALEFETLTHLISLECTDNLLSTLDLTHSPNLYSLACFNNALTNLQVTNLEYLETIECSTNQLSSLNLVGLFRLKKIVCDSNFVSNLDLHDLASLRILHFSNNNLTSMDASNTLNLIYINADSNQLTSLNIKNNSEELSVSFWNNPDIINICADNSQLIQIQNLVNIYGYNNCTVDSSCSLSSTSFHKGSNIKIYPNPVHDILTLEKNEDQKTDSFNIYNTLSQQVLCNSGNTTTLDVSSLSSGNYFLKINSANNTEVIRFIKN